ncbi:hypothetical protein K9M79_06150 [Candidatus Woesearchaeota archaeon]|nr:hypothetical protein [Candidatus Woesearchaeota archaeon]
MAKKCIICEESKADYKIRNSNEFYCQECAERNFGDIGLLEKIEKKKSPIDRYEEDLVLNTQ